MSKTELAKRDIDKAKYKAIQYLVNKVGEESSEWHGAGMYNAIYTIVNSNESEFSKSTLDSMIRNAENY